jgi:hypothetical protein
MNLQKNGEGIVIGQVLMVRGLLTHNGQVLLAGLE